MTPCDHPENARYVRVDRGTFDWIWQVCGVCGAERLQLEDGSGWYRWHGGRGE